MKIRIEYRQTAIKWGRRKMRNDIQAILAALQLTDKEVSLTFVDNQGIQELNRIYLGRDWPTNVMSFSLGEGEFSGINPQLLGDIVISVEKALADAKESQLPLEDELIFLIIHGLLHLIGYDHEGGDESHARLMRQKEQELFYTLRGYPLDLGD